MNTQERDAFMELILTIEKRAYRDGLAEAAGRARRQAKDRMDREQAIALENFAYSLEKEKW